MNNRTRLIHAVVCLAMMASASAAPVIWSTPQAISNSAELVTSGTPQTVHGVSFDSSNKTPPGFEGRQDPLGRADARAGHLFPHFWGAHAAARHRRRGHAFESGYLHTGVLGDAGAGVVATFDLDVKTDAGGSYRRHIDYTTPGSNATTGFVLDLTPANNVRIQGVAE